MRLMIIALSTALSLAWVAPDDAIAQTREVRIKKQQKQDRTARRPASVGAIGLCQRDTGTPTSQLDMRKQCDAEEFWNRMNDLGSTGDSH